MPLHAIWSLLSVILEDECNECCNAPRTSKLLKGHFCELEHRKSVVYVMGPRSMEH